MNCSDKDINSNINKFQDVFTEKLLAAKNDNSILQNIIQEYTPFIQKQLTKELTSYLEYDDCLSIAMLTFVNCIKQYDLSKGIFISYAAKAIRNRLIDESKKETNYRYHIISYSDKDIDTPNDTMDRISSITAYQKEKERETLADEIITLGDALKKFDISIKELAQIAPKQKRSRLQCLKLALQVKESQKLWNALWNTKRLPQADLAHIASVSVKTIEKHRKYIITLCVILQGSYPALKAFFLNSSLEETNKSKHHFHPWKIRKEGFK